MIRLKALRRMRLWYQVATFLAVALVVVGSFFAIVVGGRLVVGIESSFGLSILATIAIGLIIDPIKRVIDRLFSRTLFGSETPPWEATDRLAAGLAPQEDPVHTLGALAGALVAGTGADRAAIYVDVDGAQIPVAEAGSPESDSLDRVQDVPIRIAGEYIGLIKLASGNAAGLTDGDEIAVARLADRVGMVARTVRLTELLHHRIELAREQQTRLERARAAVMATQDRERRRLERDLHDMCQQQAVVLAGRLGLARALVETDGNRASLALGEVEADLQRLQLTLGWIVTGDDLSTLGRGLKQALQAFGEGLPMELEVHGTSPSLPSDVERAVLFSCMEAIQNAVKHSAGSRIEVTFIDEGNLFQFTVADDGIGFDGLTPRTGTGLANMRQRVTEVGGEVILRRGTLGTEVIGRMPLQDAT